MRKAWVAKIGTYSADRATLVVYAEDLKRAKTAAKEFIAANYPRGEADPWIWRVGEIRLLDPEHSVHWIDGVQPKYLAS
jgi:hypothetical protein